MRRLRVWWHCVFHALLGHYGHGMNHVCFPRHDPHTTHYYCCCGYLEREAWKAWDTGEAQIPAEPTGRWGPT